MSRQRIFTLQLPGGQWRAWFDNAPGAFDDGGSQAEAVGRLVLRYPDYAGLSVERKS